jgi:hypothetical protein
MIIKQPAFGVGNPRNDYGLGFYCTREIELAKEWACTEESSGYANVYEFDLSGLTVTSLSGADYSILNWLAVLLDNRTFRVSNDVAAAGKAYLLDRFLPDLRDSDAIIGYRANDSYFSFANAFLNNTLSLARLERAMYLGGLGEQTALRSPRSFERLRFIRAEAAEKAIYYPKKSARDQEARSSYRQAREAAPVVDAVYILDIMRGGWQNDDPRLRGNIPGRRHE